MAGPARSPIARSFERHVRAENRSERTIATYLQGLRQAETFLQERPDRAQRNDERERATLHPTTLEAATATTPHPYAAKSTTGALLSSDNYGSSVEGTATLHPLWQEQRAGTPV